MSEFLFDVLNNMTLILTGLYLCGKISKHPITPQSELKTRIFYGFCLGLISMLLMQMTIHPADGVLVDLRHLPVMIAAYFGGPLPTVIATMIVVVYRFTIGFSYASWVAFSFICLVAIGTSLLVKYRDPYSLRTYFLANLWGSSLQGIVLFLVLPAELFMRTLLIVLPISFTTGWLSLLMIRDLRMTKIMLQTYKGRAALDYLTGLQNLRSFNDLFESMKHATMLNDSRLAVIVLDIDHFKRVNDTYGHDAGDEVLRQFATRLSEGVGTQGIVSRNGGEEFTVLLDDPHPDTLWPLAESLRERIKRDPFILPDGNDLSVTASLGISCFPETTKHVDRLLKDADTAVYTAKLSGRDRVVLFDAKEEVAVSNHP
ncbi:GGDEF domain-containing protein [Exiguobacterium flavidum]|uniref:GGDEF domain-containing protein n=1 Tax=Exiguobacterium flavidum TaxID=2184695 RepID=UPI000DF78141|nr:diguanylate cyclase [Exiguobacterium flavidum]